MSFCVGRGPFAWVCLTLGFEDKKSAVCQTGLTKVAMIVSNGSIYPSNIKAVVVLISLNLAPTLATSIRCHTDVRHSSTHCNIRPK